MRSRPLATHGFGPGQTFAFMNGVRMPVAERADMRAGVAASNPEGVETEVSCSIEVGLVINEQADRTASMPRILRLADRMRTRPGGGNQAAARELSAAAA